MPNPTDTLLGSLHIESHVLFCSFLSKYAYVTGRKQSFRNVNLAKVTRPVVDTGLKSCLFDPIRNIDMLIHWFSSHLCFQKHPLWYRPSGPARCLFCSGSWIGQRLPILQLYYCNCSCWEGLIFFFSFGSYPSFKAKWKPYGQRFPSYCTLSSHRPYLEFSWEFRGSSYGFINSTFRYIPEMQNMLPPFSVSSWEHVKEIAT